MGYRLDSVTVTITFINQLSIVYRYFTITASNNGFYEPYV